MPEYIDRDQLQTALARKKRVPANVRYAEGWNDCLMRVESMVSAAPAANVAPVVRGCWERVDSSYWRWTPSGGVSVSHITFRCGHCYRGTVVKSAYCPNCGARMDGDPNGLR